MNAIIVILARSSAALIPIDQDDHPLTWDLMFTVISTSLILALSCAIGFGVHFFYPIAAWPIAAVPFGLYFGYYYFGGLLWASLSSGGQRSGGVMYSSREPNPTVGLVCRLLSAALLIAVGCFVSWKYDWIGFVATVVAVTVIHLIHDIATFSE